MNFKILLMAVLVLFFATGCVVNQSRNYTPGMEQQYGFNVSEGESEKVANPPSKDLARVYVYRTNSIMGFGITYGVVYSSGEFDANTIKQSPLVFYAVRGKYAYKDIKASEGMTANFFAETEAGTLITFYPKPNQIYCLETAVASGWIVGRPSMKLVDKQRCLEQMKDKTFQN